MSTDSPAMGKTVVRRGVRVRSLAVVGVRKSGESGIAAKLLDLSVTGFRIDLDGLPKGMLLWLKLPQLEPQMAKVVWSNTRETGCEFSVPLHEAVLARALRMIGADAGQISTSGGAAGSADPRPELAAAQRRATPFIPGSGVWNPVARTIGFGHR